jgi:putative nucleotidyltransferase with HDIG domain
MNWKLPYYDIETGLDGDMLDDDTRMDYMFDLAETPQDEIWHAEGDVRIHTLLVTLAVLRLKEFKTLTEQEKHILVTAALFHDIGKSKTTKEEFRDGRTCIVAPHHAAVGEKMAREILYKTFKVPFHIREHICSLVRYHGVPLWGEDNDQNKYEMKLLNISTRCNMKLLKMLSEADMIGRHCNDRKEKLETVEMFGYQCEDLGIYGKEKEYKNPDFKYHALNHYLVVDQEYPIYDETEFVVHMLSGIAGSGKDTYIKNNLNKYLEEVSLDGIRREKGISPTDKKRNGQVIQMAKEQCKVLMREKSDFIFNATNITESMRSKWIRLFMEYGGRVLIHYIESPYKDLIRQNHNRDYKVPEDVIEDMIQKLEIPTYKEAHGVIYNINE